LRRHLAFISGGVVAEYSGCLVGERSDSVAVVIVNVNTQML